MKKLFKILLSPVILLIKTIKSLSLKEDEFILEQVSKNTWKNVKTKRIITPSLLIL